MLTILEILFKQSSVNDPYVAQVNVLIRLHFLCFLYSLLWLQRSNMAQQAADTTFKLSNRIFPSSLQLPLQTQPSTRSFVPPSNLLLKDLTTNLISHSFPSRRNTILSNHSWRFAETRRAEEKANVSCKLARSLGVRLCVCALALYYAASADLQTCADLIVYIYFSNVQKHLGRSIWIVTCKHEWDIIYIG